MKKRDFYIIGFLFCVIIYAASHRKEATGAQQITPNLLNQNVKTELSPVNPDSIVETPKKVNKAGI